MASVYVSIGMGGVLIVLLAYGLLSTGRVAADSARYQWLNITGTAGILISLLGQWNVAAFVANVAWILIGIVALVRQTRKRSV